MGQLFHGDGRRVDVRRMRMTMAVMDAVRKMRIVIGLQSLTHRFLSAPPRSSGSLQSLEKQERLGNMKKVMVLKIRSQRAAKKCHF